MEIRPNQARKEKQAEFEAYEVEEEVSDIVVSDTVVKPGTVVVMFGYTPGTAPAVF